MDSVLAFHCISDKHPLTRWRWKTITYNKSLTKNCFKQYNGRRIQKNLKYAPGCFRDNDNDLRQLNASHYSGCWVCYFLKSWKLWRGGRVLKRSSTNYGPTPEGCTPCEATFSREREEEWKLLKRMTVAIGMLRAIE